MSILLNDALGRTVYTEQFSGLYSGTVTAVQQTSMLYTILGQTTQVQVQDLQPQSAQTITQATTTASYDSLGRLLTLNDPDRGTHSYTYDPDGHVLTDVSGTRTLGDNYDLLGRLGCEQDAAPPSTPRAPVLVVPIPTFRTAMTQVLSTGAAPIPPWDASRRASRPPIIRVAAP